jgi:hypothetical protein
MTDPRKAQFWDLAKRLIQLGGLLNKDLDYRDPAVLAETQIIIAEMHKTEAEMDALLDAVRDGKSPS